MKRRIIIYVALVAGGSLLAGWLFSEGERWEYNYIKLDQAVDMRHLETLGEQGWEAVGPFRDWNNGQSVLFKRKLPFFSCCDSGW